MSTNMIPEVTPSAKLQERMKTWGNLPHAQLLVPQGAQVEPTPEAPTQRTAKLVAFHPAEFQDEAMRLFDTITMADVLGFDGLDEDPMAMLARSFSAQSMVPLLTKDNQESFESAMTTAICGMVVNLYDDNDVPDEITDTFRALVVLS